MIVFTRKVGETIVINGDISVTIVRVGPNDVRLGIVAPMEISVMRNELRASGVEKIEISDRLQDGEARLIT